MAPWLRSASVVVALFMRFDPCSAAVFDFTFKPITGDSIQASGTFTTDDAPIFSTITSVTGQVNGIMITSIDLNGVNLFSPDPMAAYFSFLASYAGVDYSLSFGPSAFSTASLMASGSDGNEYEASGDLIISQVNGSPSLVPLPASAPLFGAALMGLGIISYSLKRKGKAAYSS